MSKFSQQIPQILTAASTAIRALTNSPSPPTSSSPAPPQTPTTVAAHKATFQSSTHTFFTLLSRISNSLEDQARALEAAGIIPPTAVKTVSGAGEATDSEAGVRNGGLGELDIGWLNARAGDVGKGMEGEVLARVRGILEGMSEEGQGKGNEDMLDA
jgi:hypothetical protein